MVSNKRIHCVICNKKCSGNVIRYQDQYYHKQCFEIDQQEDELKRHDQLYGDSRTANQAAAAAVASGITDTLYQIEDSQSLSEDKISTSASPGNITKPSKQHSRSSGSPKHSRSQSNSASGSQQRIVGSSGHINSLPPAMPRTSHQRTTNGNSSTLPVDRGQTLDSRSRSSQQFAPGTRSATLPHSTSSPANGFLPNSRQIANCAGCSELIKDGQALIALDLHWHVWCFKCSQCQAPLHGEYVSKDGRAYCEKDYQKLFGVTCVYCKRYITGKVLQAGEAHHFHPSCARCSKCGDPFVPGEEMYLQGEITWHPRCGPGPDSGNLLDEMALDSSSKSQLRASRAESASLSSRSRSRSASPFSFMSRQYGRSSPGYADSEAVGDLSRIYTISYLNADPSQGYLRRPIEPNPSKSPQFTRPAGSMRDVAGGSRESSRYSNYVSHGRERSVPRGMSILSSMRSSSSHRARSPSMMNEEAIQSAQYPSGQKPSPDTVPKIERDDFPAPPFPYHHDRRRDMSAPSARESQVSSSEAGRLQSQQETTSQSPQQRASRPRSREVVIDDEDSLSSDDPRFKKEEEELSKIASGIGKIFLQTLKEREKLRAWKRANLDPRNASRTPSATRELPSRLRYDNATNASPSRDMDRPRPWEDDEANGTDHSPTRTRSSLGRPSQMSSSTYGYKVVQSNRSTPKPGYGLTSGPYESSHNGAPTVVPSASEMSFNQQQRLTQNRSTDLLVRANNPTSSRNNQQSELSRARSQVGSAFGSAHLRRSMPNVNMHHIHHEGPPKLYPYHLLATSNYRLPPDVDRCHLERHLSNEEFQYIFHCDRLDFYRLPEWKRNELKRRARLF